MSTSIMKHTWKEKIKKIVLAWHIWHDMTLQKKMKPLAFAKFDLES